MEKTILEMQGNLDEGHYIAFISENDNPYCVALKSDELNFLDDKTVVIRKKGGKSKIINLNLIIEICIRRFGQYA
jgi:hypothetical protein